MEEFKNKAESFFREIRAIEIYKALDVHFVDNFMGIFPKVAPQMRFNIVSETFNRSILTKTQNGNYYYEVSINFPLLDLSKSTVDKCFKRFNKKEFVIILISNTERVMIGNDVESLKIIIDDAKKDDNSGSDEYIISISGETIIPPRSESF